MYRVRKPFLTKRSQFKKGEESLAIGIKLDALQGEGIFELELRSDPSKSYWHTKDFLREFAVAKGTHWKSPKGSIVAIFPLDLFTVRKSLQTTLF